MRKLLLACAALCLLGAIPSQGQVASAITQTVGVCDPTPYVHNCAKPDVNGAIPVTGTISASLSGFTPTAGATANITDIVNTSQDVALPAGSDIVVTNKGTVDINFRIQVGAGTAVSTDQPLKAGAAVGLHVLTSTHLSAIAPTGTGTGSTAGQLNVQGGIGLASGYGGSSSAGGGSNAAASATGSAVPASASYNGISVGGTLTGQTGTSGGNANDNIAQVGGAAVQTGHGTASGSVRVELPTDGTGQIVATQGTAANLKSQVSVASGGIASGGVASGAVASGAYASGSVASGAYAAGALATGAGVDGWDVTEGAKADGVCGTATGTCSITALIKYLNSQVAAMPNTGGCGSLIPISQTASTDLHTSSGKTYICSIILVVPDAEVVSLVEGTGTVCATGIAAVIGATTAANGMSLAANGGFSAVSSAPIVNTQTTNDHLCLLQSGSGRIAGFISYNDH